MCLNNSLKLSLFPLTTGVDSHGHLHIGSCDCIELTKEYGSPLYIFDEFTIRSKCKEFKDEFSRRYHDTVIAYASKAFLNRALALIIKEEGMGLDVVSGGELSVAQAVEFPKEMVYFHGNNKTPDELRLALEWGIGHIVVDNFYEIELLNSLCMEQGITQDVLLRISPGVDAHTHHHTTTGILDSKFGFPLITGQAEAAVEKALAASHLHPAGLHFHLGSPVTETSPYELAIDLVLRFSQEMTTKYRFQLMEFVPGGGFPARYTLNSPIMSIADYAGAITTALISNLETLGLAAPRLVLEPGRSIVAQAGVALYTVGCIKDIPGVRKYVCVNGGMGDNIRPALYDAKYEAIVANRIGEEETTTVTIAGKYCESGDILARDVTLASVETGDIIAMPVSGAYALPMSSNYNMVTRPAIVMVKDGKPRIIRKREGYQDLMRLDRI